MSRPPLVRTRLLPELVALALIVTPGTLVTTPPLMTSVLPVATPLPTVRLAPSRFQVAPALTLTVLLFAPEPTMSAPLHRLALVTVIVLKLAPAALPTVIAALETVLIAPRPPTL